MSHKSNSDHEWNRAMGKARDVAGNAGEMAGHAASALGSMAGQTACGMGQRADEMAASAGRGIHDFGERISENAPRSGMFGSASQAFANSVRSSGDYIEEAKLSGIADDVTELIRKNPLPAILIAISAGWFLARKLGS